MHLPAPSTQVHNNVAHISVCRENRLTWHSGLIPSSEVWVKIGGDKGGGSMKTSFQLCNVPHPNSSKNSCVFSIYEAPDSPTNLNIALGPFKEQISGLCGKQIWRYTSYSIDAHLVYTST